MRTAVNNLRDRFRTDGYAFPLDALTPEEAARALTDCRTYLRAVSSVGGAMAQYAMFPKIHLVATWADRLVHHPALLGLAESLLGPDLMVWSTNLFTRPAHSGGSLAWHQDAVYLGLNGYQEHAVRVWVALTDTTAANGTMRYSRGSHAQGALAHRWGGTHIEDIMRGEEVAVEVDESSSVAVVLTAGQCSAHHLAMVHCSGANTTDHSRYNFAIDYISPKVRPTEGEDSALTVRGEGGSGFLPEARPLSDFHPDAVRQFYAATARRQARIDHTVRHRSTT
ncbi:MULTISPECIES: phytanoyl-CoA dioxygenase family protein [Streptomyces]|uniref:Phytanoyl-CoA dioxygenase family protein n=1 Tax=Streptomyces mutomycini TaxID=284036 RepID=A0ABW0B832_9ACTN|nr:MULTISPECIES: phytanoyl-CoA dioxygenase family protein [Streptomyces]